MALDIYLPVSRALYLGLSGIIYLSMIIRLPADYAPTQPLQPVAGFFSPVLPASAVRKH